MRTTWSFRCEYHVLFVMTLQTQHSMLVHTQRQCDYDTVQQAKHNRHSTADAAQQAKTAGTTHIHARMAQLTEACSTRSAYAKRLGMSGQAQVMPDGCACMLAF